MLVYTTLNHIKYCLPNGDHGIIRTLDVPGPPGGRGREKERGLGSSTLWRSPAVCARSFPFRAVYLTKVFGNTLFALDREAKPRTIQARLPPGRPALPPVLLSLTPAAAAAGSTPAATAWAAAHEGSSP